MSLWDTDGNLYEVIDSMREEGSDQGSDILYLLLKYPYPSEYQIGWVAGNEGIGGRFTLSRPLLLWFCSKPCPLNTIQKLWERCKLRIQNDLPPPMEMGVVEIRETPPIAEATKQDFVALADAQRGDPEAAMIAAQEVLGGGIMSFVIEHVGDLIHRMNEGPTWRYAGYDYVLEKVNKTLRMLKSGYGFMREFSENLAATAQYRKVDESELRQEAFEALKNYAEEHRKLSVYNKAHQFARAAAIALGEVRISDAVGFLEALLVHLKSEEEWVRFAREGCDLREDEEVERVKFSPGWGCLETECLCGNTFNKSGFERVEPVFGIGNRATGDYDQSYEGDYFLCLSCGRVIASSKAEEPEGIVVRPPTTMAEDKYPHVPNDGRPSVDVGAGPWDWLCSCGAQSFYPAEPIYGIGNRVTGYRVAEYVPGQEENPFMPMSYICGDCKAVFASGHGDIPAGTLLYPE